MENRQLKGLARNTIDKYYTKDSIAKLCLTFVKEYIQIELNDIIIEPSAGDGVFIVGIKQLTDNFLFYDIEPENDEIILQDYLLFDYSDIKKKYNKIHVIGNPPFGRQSSLAKKFIKRSCQFCDSISFILPKSFKKDSFKKTFPLNFHLIYEFDLPINSFLVDNIEYNVETVFQIWIKKDIERFGIINVEPLHFIFVKKTEKPDISFRRVGVNAGAISILIDNKSIQSHYFIKFTNNKSTEENIQRLSTLLFEFNNTVGPKSISKQELITKFNILLETTS